MDSMTQANANRAEQTSATIGPLTQHSGVLLAALKDLRYLVASEKAAAPTRPGNEKPSSPSEEPEKILSFDDYFPEQQEPPRKKPLNGKHVLIRSPRN